MKKKKTKSVFTISELYIYCERANNRVLLEFTRDALIKRAGSHQYWSIRCPPSQGLSLGGWTEEETEFASRGWKKDRKRDREKITSKGEYIYTTAAAAAAESFS